MIGLALASLALPVHPTYLLSGPITRLYCYRRHASVPVGLLE